LGHDNIVQERRYFNIADRNKDGGLDVDEVATILQRGNPNMQKAQIELLFGLVDRNKDGKIEFNELVDFIHSGPGSCKRAREQIKSAFHAPLTSPGPASYSGSKGKCNVRGGSFGKSCR